jgi:hypothetical protein
MPRLIDRQKARSDLDFTYGVRNCTNECAADSACEVLLDSHLRVFTGVRSRYRSSLFRWSSHRCVAHP